MSAASSSTSPVADATSVHIDAPKPIEERYPMCIVWTPIPLITWILPFVGHMGIADSTGIIYDFAGPYYIGEDNLAFGNPVKYWRIDHLVAKASLPSERSGLTSGPVAFDLTVENNADGSSEIRGADAARAVRLYDEAVYNQRDHFRKTQNYNFFCNNCHSFCAFCIEDFGGGRGQTWNMVKLAAAVFFFGKYVSFGRFMLAHLPFFLIVAGIAMISVWTSHK